MPLAPPHPLRSCVTASPWSSRRSIPVELAPPHPRRAHAAASPSSSSVTPRGERMPTLLFPAKRAVAPSTGGGQAERVVAHAVVPGSAHRRHRREESRRSVLSLPPLIRASSCVFPCSLTPLPSRHSPPPFPGRLEVLAEVARVEIDGGWAFNP
ncbi:hypothetical protein VPH35_072651 [Triticum aestivum]